MLDDKALTETGLRGDRGGVFGRRCLDEALDAEIAGYEASDEDYFRARSADIRDIRAQVLRG